MSGKIQRKSFVFVMLLGLLAAAIIGCGGAGSDPLPLAPQELKITGQISDLALSVLPGSFEEYEQIRGAVSPASVTVYLESEPTKRTVTDSDGYFVITGVRMGQHRVIALTETLDGRVFKNRSAVLTVSDTEPVAEAGSISLLEAVAYAEGILRNESGSVIRNARLTIWGESFWTDSQGRFTTPPMPDRVTAEIITADVAYQTVSISVDFDRDVVPFIEQTLVTPQATNRPPTVSLKASTYKTEPGQAVDLTARASDPDNDYLFYHWRANAGSLSTGDNEPSAVWTAPDDGVNAKITISVTDGRLWATSSVEIVSGDGGAPDRPSISSIQPHYGEPLYDNRTYELSVIATDTVGGLTYQWIIPKGTTMNSDTASVSWRTPYVDGETMQVPVKIRVVNANSIRSEMIATYTVIPDPDPPPYQKPEISLSYPIHNYLYNPGPIFYRAEAIDNYGEAIESSAFRWYQKEHEGPGAPNFDNAELIGQTREFTLELEDPATYALKLEVTDKEGESSSEIIYFRVNAPPVASINEPSPGQHFRQGEEILFRGSAVDIEDGVIPASGLFWYFAGETVRGQSEVTWSTLPPGENIVYLVATDSLNAVSELATVTLMIHEGPTINSITPVATYSRVLGDPVTFVADVTHPSETVASAGIIWESDIQGVLGDGYTLVTEVMNLGTHQVTLTVTDSWGGMATAETAVIILEDFEIEITSPSHGDSFQQGEEILFRCDADDYNSVNWDFGGVHQIIGASPNVDQFYSDLPHGTHTISLIAFTAGGDPSHSTEIDIFVNPGPDIQSVSVSPPSVREGASSTFEIEVAHEYEDIADMQIKWSYEGIGIIIEGPLQDNDNVQISTLPVGENLEVSIEVTDRWAGVDYATATITVTQNASPTVTIISPYVSGTERERFELGEFISFQAQLNGNAPSYIVNWSSDIDGDLGSDLSIPIDYLASGPHTITFSADDGFGGTDEDSIEIFVNSLPEISISYDTAEQYATGPADIPVFITTSPDIKSLEFGAEADLDVSYQWYYNDLVGAPDGTDDEFNVSLSDGLNRVYLRVFDNAWPGYEHLASATTYLDMHLWRNRYIPFTQPAFIGLEDCVDIYSRNHTSNEPELYLSFNDGGDPAVLRLRYQGANNFDFIASYSLATDSSYLNSVYSAALLGNNLYALGVNTVSENRVVGFDTNGVPIASFSFDDDANSIHSDGDNRLYVTFDDDDAIGRFFNDELTRMGMDNPKRIRHYDTYVYVAREDDNLITRRSADLSGTVVNYDASTPMDIAFNDNYVFALTNGGRIQVLHRSSKELVSEFGGVEAGQSAFGNNPVSIFVSSYSDGGDLFIVDNYGIRVIHSGLRYWFNE